MEGPRAIRRSGGRLSRRRTGRVTGRTGLGRLSRVGASLLGAGCRWPSRSSRSRRATPNRRKAGRCLSDTLGLSKGRQRPTSDGSHRSTKEPSQRRRRRCEPTSKAYRDSESCFGREPREGEVRAELPRGFSRSVCCNAARETCPFGAKTDKRYEWIELLQVAYLVCCQREGRPERRQPARKGRPVA